MKMVEIARSKADFALKITLNFLAFVPFAQSFFFIEFLKHSNKQQIVKFSGKRKQTSAFFSTDFHTQ